MKEAGHVSTILIALREKALLLLDYVPPYVGRAAGWMEFSHPVTWQKTSRTTNATAIED